MNPKPKTWEEGLDWVCGYMRIGPDPIYDFTLEELYDDEDYPALARRACSLVPKFNINAFKALMAKKHHDYGPENINKFGYKGVEIRLWDKIARHSNLIDRGTRAGDLGAFNESIDDTLIDIVGYCVIWYMLAQGVFDLPLAADVKVSKPLTLTRESWNPEWELASDSRN